VERRRKHLVLILARAVDLQARAARSSSLRGGETFEPSAKPLHVRAAAGEKLAAEAQVETSSADDVGHEGVARDETAVGKSS
jgi:hypothetical protein